MKKIFFIISAFLLALTVCGQSNGETQQIDHLSDSIRASISKIRPGLFIFGSKLETKDEFPAAFYVDTSSKQLLAVVQNELFEIEPDSGTYNAAPLIDTLTYTYYFRDNKLTKVTVQQNVGQANMVNAIFYFRDNKPFYKISVAEGKTTVIDGDDDVSPVMLERSETCIRKSRKYLEPNIYSRSN